MKKNDRKLTENIFYTLSTDICKSVNILMKDSAGRE